MSHRGNLLKMRTELNDPVLYYLRIGDQEILLNELLGKETKLTYHNQINCIKCGRITKKSFSQGFCYPCFQSAPETEECVLRPELCQAHEGIARDIEFAKSRCLIDHFVYLSLTSDIKVGVTRNTQIPTRWIDQGATKAIKLAKTPNRYTAGLIEVALKKHMPDKTNWRAMLLNQIKTDKNIASVKEETFDHIPSELTQFVLSENEVTEINYPVLNYPEKIKSLGFDKLPEITEKLTGIKGQYLLFDGGHVLNIRKHGGYLVEIEC